MASHSSTLAWKIPWMEKPGGLQSMGLLRVGHDWATSLSLFTFHALEKEMATPSSVLAWRIPRTGESGGLPSMGSHRVGHNWSDLAAAAAAYDLFPRHFSSIQDISDSALGSKATWWGILLWEDGLILTGIRRWASQGALVVKNPPANAGDVGLIPASGRSPGGGHGKPLQYSCLENPMDRGAWQATVQGL